MENQDENRGGEAGPKTGPLPSLHPLPGSEPVDPHAPKTLWEDRAAAAEGAVERLMNIVARHLPATRAEIEAVAAEWNRIRREINEEYSQNK